MLVMGRSLGRIVACPAVAVLVAACTAPVAAPASVPPPASAAGRLAHQQLGGIGFDDPAEWSIQSFAGQLPVFGVLQVLWTPPATAGCAPPGGPPVTTELTGMPHGPPLTKAMPISCSTSMDGTQLECWKLALTITWGAGDGRAAGSARLLHSVDLDGRAREYGRESDTIPYMR